MSAIVCYSRAGQNLVGGGLVDLKIGVMERFCRELQRQLKEDCGILVPLYQIEPKEQYPHSFNETVVRVDGELEQQNFPKISVEGFDANRHHVLICGFPIWLGTMATPMISFLQQPEIHGKKIIPLCTSEVSQWGCSKCLLKRLSLGEEVTEGLWVRDIEVNDDMGRAKIATWLQANPKLIEELSNDKRR